jgi:hypothetical protein
MSRDTPSMLQRLTFWFLATTGRETQSPGFSLMDSESRTIFIVGSEEPLVCADRT